MKKITAIFTYIVKFEEIPHFYWGVHLQREGEKFYLGSPKTHKWMWDFYTPIITPLQFFSCDEEGWEEAQKIEKRLILPDLENPLCLNENVGGVISLRVLMKNHEKTDDEGRSLLAVRMGQKAMETHKKNGTLFFSSEWQSEMGQRGSEKCRQLGVGACHDPELNKQLKQKMKEEQSGFFNPAVQTKGRQTQKEQKLGFFDPEKQQKGRKTQKERGVGFFDPEVSKRGREAAAAKVSKGVKATIVETNEVFFFPSISQTGAFFNTTRGTVRDGIEKNQPKKGILFERTT
jgi:hypothetical protein